MHTFADFLRQGNAMCATRRQIAVVLICVASAFTCEIALAEPLYRFGVPPWQRGQSVDRTGRRWPEGPDKFGPNADKSDARARITRLPQPPARRFAGETAPVRIMQSAVELARRRRATPIFTCDLLSHSPSSSC